MNVKGLTPYVGTLFLIILLVAGCGSGGSGSSSGNNATNNSIGGVASKGIIDGGTATAYAVNADGTKGAELGTGQTAANGRYKIDIGNYSGPVIIEVSGGVYTDEATGTITGNNRLRAIIPVVKDNAEVAVTPLTEIAVQIAGATYNVTRINNANAAVAVLIGGADITETQPQEVDSSLMIASKAEKNYTMVLASISQMIEDGSATDVADAITVIKEDLEDDGELSVDGSGAGEVLTNALDNFVNSPDNKTWLTKDDVSFDESIVEASVKLYLVNSTEDVDNDAFIDQYTYYSYDANGYRTMKEDDGMSDDDILPDGNINFRVSTFRNEDGQVVRQEKDYNGDGVANEVKTFSPTIPNNNIAVENRTSQVFISTNPDGSYSYIVSNTYDPAIRKFIKSFDSNGDGTPEQYKISTYNDNGKKIMEETDKGADGVIDLRYEWTIDANGNRATFTSDGAINNNELPDGVANVTQRFTYNADHKMILNEADNNGDGVFNFTQTFEYNADGKWIFSEYNYNSNIDAVIDSSDAYEYNASGKKTKHIHDWYGDGTMVDVTTYFWQTLEDYLNSQTP